ncbi:hypothetical protein AURDEDRAFT_161446 [Auricularia subglabra TFB-10046 SS5]|nr:hypothetical protein AURDEDRAFT_161446 [Auricularia subglabra TFB-10046 SS5]
MSFMPNLAYRPQTVLMGPPPPPPPAAPALTMPPPPHPMSQNNNSASARRNTVSGSEPMRVDTSRTMPVLFLGNASFGNVMSCSPVSMMDAEMERVLSPTKGRGELGDQVECVAEQVANAHLSVREYGERTIEMLHIDREIVEATHARCREVDGRVIELANVAQAISVQVDGICIRQDATTKAVCDVNALVNRLGVEIHGEHGNPETGILHVLNQLVFVLGAFKSQVEQNSLEMARAVQQVDARVQQVEEFFSSRFGPRSIDVPRATNVARFVAAVQVPHANGGAIEGGRNGTPVPRYTP